MNLSSNLDIASIYASKSAQSFEQFEINFLSGAIVLSEPGMDNPVYEVDKHILPGVYSLNVYFLDDTLLQKMEAQPTSGINFIELNINDYPINSWVETRNSSGAYLIDPNEAISFVITDLESLEEISSHIPAALEQSYAEGLQAINQNTAWVIYVGEMTAESRFFWALDENQVPVKLVGYFRYDVEGNVPSIKTEEDKELDLITFNLAGKTYQIDIQILRGEGTLEITEYNDTCYIKKGKQFSIKISKLTNDRPLEAFVQMAKMDAKTSSTFNRFVLDEDRLCILEKNDRIPIEFRFFGYTQLSGVNLEIIDNYTDGPFSLEAIERMREISFEIKELKL